MSPPVILVSPSSALLNSLGTIHILFASPWAIWGSVCRYWYANRAGSGLASWIAWNVVSIALAWPWAVRNRAARSPSARRMRDWRSASAARMADCFWPSAVRIWAAFWPSAVLMADSRCPSAVRTSARLFRSARICCSIASWMDAGGSIALISTRATRMPQGPVASSSTPRNWVLISSRLVSACSRFSEPTTLRSVVMVSCSTAWM